MFYLTKCKQNITSLSLLVGMTVEWTTAEALVVVKTQILFSSH